MLHTFLTGWNTRLTTTTGDVGALTKITRKSMFRHYTLADGTTSFFREL